MPPAPKRLDRKQLDRDLAALRQRLQRMSALAETGREDRIQAAKADFRLFCQTYLPHYLDRPSSSFHHWIFAQSNCWGQGAKLCIAAPRGYAKTTYLVRAYCLWRLARGDAAFPVLLQDSSELAEQSLAVIKIELEDNPRLAADFPELTGEGRLWRQDKIITASGVPVAALGSGKRIRGLNINGLRPSLVLADDLENDENVLSKTQRDKVHNWFVKAVLELGLADGSLQVILVGTMLHADCLVARMQRRPDFESHTFSAVARMPERLDLWDEWGRLLAVDAPAAAAFYKAHQGEMDAGAEVLWPEMEPLERLMAKRALDPHTFQTEKQNQPLDPDSQVFRTLHFYVEMPNAWRLIVGAVDPAQGLIKGDFTGIIILGQRDDRKALVLEADVTRRNPMATVDRVIELQRKWGCAQWAVEDVAAQATLFDEMEEKDPHIGHLASIRKRAVSGRSWQVDAADDSPKAAEIAGFCQTALEALPLRQAFRDALDATGKGFAALELYWDVSAGQAVPTRLEFVEQRRFGWLRLGNGALELGLAGDGSLREPEPLWPFKWLVHRSQARSGLPWRGPLYRTLAWLYLFRNYNLAGWARFVESYGIPTRLGRYPAGATESEQDTLLAAAQAISSEAAVIIPQGMQLELLEKKFSSGAKTPHEGFLDWTTRSISIALIGGTLTTDTASGGGGAYALGEVHNQVRWDLQRDDAEQLCATCNRDLIRPLVDLNFGPQQAYPTLAIDVPEPADLQALAQVIATLGQAGYDEIPLWWIRQKFHIPKAEADEPTLRSLRQASAPASPAAPAASARPDAQPAPQQARAGGFLPPQLAANAAQSQAVTEAEAHAEATVDALSRQVQDELVAPLLARIQACGSFEEALATVQTGFDHAATEGLGHRLARAGFIANLYGQLDVQNAQDGQDAQSEEEDDA